MKIKCDGKQPCTHCAVSSYECTYDQPTTRRRTVTPQYVEALETQLKRAKAILSLVLPSLDLNDGSIDTHLQNGMLPPLSQPISNDAASYENLARQDIPDPHLESMLRATRQLDLDEDGYWDYQGHSSGLIFTRRLQQQYVDIITSVPPSNALLIFGDRPVSRALDSPNLHTNSSNADPARTNLPSKKKARMLCDNALLEVGTLLRVVHLPLFYSCLDRIYETPPDGYDSAEDSFLPLLFAVLALGILFSKSNGELDKAGYETNIQEGYKYFRASRQLLDIANCRDLTSLQAIVFMIQFLQSSAKLSTCCAYIGVALRSAIRMGFHRSFNINFSPIEAETRKRLFWVVRRMDIYVSAMLGLPHFLEDEDVDQEYPAEVDDEYITKTEIQSMSEGRISITAASNAHTKIVQVLLKICKYVYPTKGIQSGGQNSATYTVSYSKIREIEQDMQRWLDQLPMALKPGGEAPHIITKAQQLLHMAFGHAQLLLYRPFLHYISRSYRSKPSVDQRASACAYACISVSRNIIHITAEMKRHDLLIGAY